MHSPPPPHPHQNISHELLQQHPGRDPLHKEPWPAQQDQGQSKQVPHAYTHAMVGHMNIMPALTSTPPTCILYPIHILAPDF